MALDFFGSGFAASFTFFGETATERESYVSNWLFALGAAVGLAGVIMVFGIATRMHRLAGVAAVVQLVCVLTAIHWLLEATELALDATWRGIYVLPLSAAALDVAVVLWAARSRRASVGSRSRSRERPL